MKKVEIPDNLGYITSTTKKYWCHICKKDFQRLFIENTEVHCRTCGKTFCEEIINENVNEHPSNYQPYEPRNTRQTRIRTIPFFDIFNYFNEEAQMENIINFLMANDPNKYGNPPASKEEVEKLIKIKITTENRNEINNISAENSCSVCKDDYEDEQIVIKLPCNHFFHEECLMPWLKERNSCPTCRFELKTDDEDYEKRKNEKREQLRNTSSTNLSNINNLNSSTRINQTNSSNTENNNRTQEESDDNVFIRSNYS